MSKYFLSIKNENTDEATIDIDGFIGESWWKPEDKNNSLARIKNELKKIDNSKAKVITVNIHSLGGDLDHALAIHDTLLNHTAKIRTIVIGACASAATVIACSGDERLMSDNAAYLIHKCSSCFWGNENDLEAEIESQRTFNERVVNLYKKISPKSEEEIKNLMNENNGKGKWITAQEAKDFGFVTTITNASRKVACFNKQMFQNSNLPGLPEGFDYLIENDNESLFTKIKNYFDEKFNNTGNNANLIHNNSLEMKKLFPTICVMLALADDTVFDKDKGFVFSEDQLKKLEDKLKNIDTLTNEVTTLKNEATEKDNKITELQGLVDNATPEIKKPKGNDAGSSDPESFEDSMKTNPNYQAAAADLGITL